jgi:hypothetical protein
MLHLSRSILSLTCDFEDLDLLPNKTIDPASIGRIAMYRYQTSEQLGIQQTGDAPSVQIDEVMHKEELHGALLINS